MNNYSKATQRDNKAALLSTMAEFINALYPILKERLEQGYQLKSDGSFYKKDADIKQLINDRFDALTVPSNIKMVQAYISKSGDSLQLMVKGYYKVSDTSCDYITDYVYLQDVNTLGFYKFNERKALTVKEMESKEQELRQLEAQEDEIRSRISQLKRELEV